jgi:hypothetical protein
MATDVGGIVGSWGITQTRDWITERKNSVGVWIASNTVGQTVATLRRSGSKSIGTWRAPDSKGYTITAYQVGIKRGGVWKYYTRTARTITFSHARRTTASFRVRALTALGYGPWSTVKTIRRN